jgi:hypothetical protein
LKLWFVWNVVTTVVVCVLTPTVSRCVHKYGSLA